MNAPCISLQYVIDVANESLVQIYIVGESKTFNLFNSNMPKNHIKRSLNKILGIESFTRWLVRDASTRDGAGARKITMFFVSPLPESSIFFYQLVEFECPHHL